ncbi:cysteine desulfurase NifS [Clostridia bacterium]|nr:cysteine desulfurase NifS [Clostridia bacterium]
MIYLDNAATTRVKPEAADFVRAFMTAEYFNIGASYPQAAALAARAGEARKAIAETVGARRDELYFTGSATEANNMVLRGAIRAKNKTLLLTAGEHASVYNTAQSLKAAYTVKIAPLRADGRVDTDRLSDAVDENAALVSVIHVNNETGAVNDIAAICRAVKAKNKNCLFHSDGVQAFGKLPVNVRESGIDFYTVSGHKIGAPKGIAALYVRKGVYLNPLITGGGQESGMRAGTENVPGIMGLYRALQVTGNGFCHFDNGFCHSERSEESRPITVNRQLSTVNLKAVRLREILSDGGLKLKFNGGDTFLKSDASEGIMGNQSPYITSVSVVGLKAETLSNLCAERGVVIGLGSACAASKEGNRVLAAMNLARSEIDGNIRISLCADTTDEEIERAAKVILECAKELLDNKVKSNDK